MISSFVERVSFKKPLSKSQKVSYIVLFYQYLLVEFKHSACTQLPLPNTSFQLATVVPRTVGSVFSWKQTFLQKTDVSKITLTKLLFFIDCVHGSTVSTLPPPFGFPAARMARGWRVGILEYWGLPIFQAPIGRLRGMHRTRPLSDIRVEINEDYFKRTLTVRPTLSVNLLRFFSSLIHH